MEIRIAPHTSPGARPGKTQFRPVGFRPVGAFLLAGLLSGILAGGMGPAKLFAQDAEPAGVPTVAAVYELAKTAATLDECSRVIEQCRQLQETDLSEANATYIQQLLSFVQNRRGELYANQATDLQDQGGSPEDAGKLDALALADFEAAVKNDASRWKPLHNRGVSYAVIGQYEKAVQDFSRAIELKPDYANAWFNRAEIRYELGQFKEAANDYSQAIRLKPNDDGAYTSRGHAYFQLGQFSQALADYNQAVRLASDSAEAYVNRGDAYRSLSQWPQAAEDYRRAIRLDEKSGRAYQSAGWLMATCPDARYRNPEMAIQAAERAVQLEGRQDHRILDTLAAAYANAGRFDDAQKTLEEALPLATSDAESALLQQRLKLYATKQPYRQTPSTP